jgi:hypothetical protein
MASHLACHPPHWQHSPHARFTDTHACACRLPPVHLQVITREISRGYYSPFSYTASKLVLDGLVLRTLPALLFTLPFYWLMGLQPSAACFFTFLLTFAAFNCTVGALALAASSLLSSAGKTILAMNVVLLLGVLFGGFLANKEVMPAALRWITYLSAFRWVHMWVVPAC